MKPKLWKLPTAICRCGHFFYEDRFCCDCGRYNPSLANKGRPITKGRNARGICAHKRTKGAKRAKRQHQGGNIPWIRSSPQYSP